jgi:putative membrane protein
MIKIDFPLATRTGWPVMLLTILFFTFIDIIIDPVALQGERWFLGRIYYYPEPGTLFGVPIANYIGWAIVGLISLA